MKILFSPSETKTFLATHAPINEQSFIFSSLYHKRLEVIDNYETLIAHASKEELQKLFGIKNSSQYELFSSYLNEKNLQELSTCKAIMRYDGVAYQHLAYSALPFDAQTWIDNQVMIFSNLFGPLLAKDLIPFYKLQQGESIGGFKPEIFYKQHFSSSIDTWLHNEIVLDLRAGFYEKFYTLKQPSITMKFLKNGKVVSHFAKAYRGEILKLLALKNIKTFEQLLNLQIENLSIVEIKEQKLKKEIVYTIG